MGPSEYSLGGTCSIAVYPLATEPVPTYIVQVPLSRDAKFRLSLKLAEIVCRELMAKSTAYKRARLRPPFGGH